MVVLGLLGELVFVGFNVFSMLLNVDGNLDVELSPSSNLTGKCVDCNLLGWVGGSSTSYEALDQSCQCGLGCLDP